MRLLSPFMPFITEELYQRLPRCKAEVAKVSTITVAPYPDPKECRWKNEDVENEVEFIQKVAKAIRSARSDYNLPNKTKTEGMTLALSSDIYLYYNNSFLKLSFSVATRIQRKSS